MLATVAGFLFLLLAVPIAAYDLLWRRIPDAATLGGAVLLLGARLVPSPGPQFPGGPSVQAPLVGGIDEISALVTGPAIGAGLLYALWYLSGGGVGRGDAKYALQVGLVVPGAAVIVSLSVACLLALTCAAGCTLLGGLQGGAGRGLAGRRRGSARVSSRGAGGPAPSGSRFHGLSLPFAPFLAAGTVITDTLIRVRGW
jgi:prepilin signal peptidase PulO-like enzyme (type II secretory pathway)